MPFTATTFIVENAIKIGTDFLRDFASKIVQKPFSLKGFLAEA